MFTVFGFLLGIIFGSFCSALIYRLRHKISISSGRSVCTSCGTQLAWYHNIPIVSFVFLRGLCAFCKKPISWRYPLIELSFGVLLAFVFWYHQLLPFGFTIFFRDIVIVCVLAFIFIYDALYQEIWDASTWYVGGAVFILHSFISFFYPDILVPSIDSMLIGGTIVGGFFGLQFIVSKGRWIGQGDIGLGVLIGVLLGWEKALAVLFLAYVIGAIVGIILLLTNRKNFGSEIAFGTFLALSAVVMLFFGDQIIDWYLFFIGV